MAARWLALAPLIVVLAAIEHSHSFGWEMPIPFLGMFAALVVAAVAGGRLLGMIAGGLCVAEIYHCHTLGFGPATLTGSPGNVLLGALLYCGAGYWLGWLRDRLDKTFAMLARKQAGLTADLKDEKQAREQSLNDTARHAARLQTALRLASLGHFEFETETGNCVFCSDRHAAHFGLTPAEFQSETAGTDPQLSYVHRDDREKVRAWIARIRRGEHVELEYRVVHRDGGIRHIREVVEPEFDGQGRVIREVGTSMDLTELRLAETKLRESQKLEAVGRLTAGVAHDFNNLLAVIMGNLELLQETGSPADHGDMIDAALGATRRGAVLTSKLLSFGRKSILSPEPLDLCATVAELGTLFRRTLPASIDVQMPEYVHGCVANVDRAQFESAMLNLVLNASDAMVAGGSLAIRCARRQLDAQVIRRSGLALEPGDYVAIGVEDTGRGMPEDVRIRATEPFFTTKGVGKGSGLGLSMVLGFVKQSGGEIDICSEAGRGTTVTLYFRVAADTPPARVDSDAPAVTARGDGALVLLVEDDAGVRRVTARQIATLGYRVIQAGDAQAALDLVATHPDIAVVLSDVVMPGAAQGTDLARKLRELQPALPCILMSGYHHMAAEAEGNDGLAVRRLIKPIARGDLAASLSQAIRSRTVNA